jgi:hypothetical protein
MEASMLSRSARSLALLIVATAGGLGIGVTPALAASAGGAGALGRQIVAPGDCPPAFNSAVAFAASPDEPEIFCYAGHGTSSIGINDVYHFFAGPGASGTFHFDFGDGSCRNTFSFTPFQQNTFPTPINVCSGWHLN